MPKRKYKFPYIGIDQYGEFYHIGFNPPRKRLMELLGKKTAYKIYIDRKDGSARHCGWIIGDKWVEVFEVRPINSEDKS